MPPSLTAMRKTAQGILLELENSRQHYHQRLDKINWERAIDSALQNSIRSLTEVDGSADGADVASLTREAELLKANAGREALREVMDQDKGGDAGLMQVLLSAQFDIISSLNDILSMSEHEAVQQAKKVLTRLLQTCSTAASQIVKPDGSLSVVEAFPPTKRGTPKRKKQPTFTDSVSRPVPVMPALAAAAPQVFVFTNEIISKTTESSPRQERDIFHTEEEISVQEKRKMAGRHRIWNTGRI